MYKKLTVIIFLQSAHLFANSEIVMPDATFSKNYEYIYIYQDTKWKNKILVSGKDGKFIELPRQKYSKEGVYQLKKDKFLWSIEDEKLSYNVLVYPMNDGIHLMAKNSYLPTTLNEHIFSFYKQGKLIKKFKVADFCSNPKMLEQSPFGPGIVWYSEDELNFDSMIYKFKSCNKGFEIDIATGKVTSKDIPAKPKTGVLNWFKNFFR